MLNLFQDTYGTQFNISKLETAEGIDRRLKTSLKSKDLKAQLDELLAFTK